MMDELISRQDAIDALGAEPEVWINDDDYAMGLKNQWQWDINALKAVPSAQPAQRWIPCRERLPDVAQRVLLSGHGEVMVGMLHSFGKYSLEPTGISYVYPKNDIEAWMPLPEPYREDGE